MAGAFGAWFFAAIVPPETSCNNCWEGYRVDPGQRPREFQFKPGQSGNPKGAKRKSPSILPDLKGLLEDALGGNITLHHDNKERTITKLVAGIEHLVDQFARGDRYARRDLIDLADRLGGRSLCRPRSS